MRRIWPCSLRIRSRIATFSYETEPGATAYFDVLANDTDLDIVSLSLIGVSTPGFGQTSLSHNMVKYVADVD